MQKAIHNFVRICADQLPFRGPVYEFGAYRVQDMPEQDLRPLFPDLEYVGSDMREGPGVDRVLDLHELSLADHTAATVLCLDTLEHVEYPRQAMAEIYRILRPDGIVLISSVFDFPIHNYPNDYWRFTPEGFRSLLQDFHHSEVFSFGRSDTSPQSLVGIGFKGAAPDLTEFRAQAEKWEKWNSAVIRELIKSKQQLSQTS